MMIKFVRKYFASLVYDNTDYLRHRLYDLELQVVELRREANELKALCLNLHKDMYIVNG